MERHCLALAFYQNPRTAASVLKKLRNSGVRQCAIIHKSHFGRVSFQSSSLLLWLSRIFPTSEFKTIESFKEKMIRDETLLLVFIKPDQVQTALNILRFVESGHPVSFLLRTPISQVSVDEYMGVEPLSLDYLSEYAKHLAPELQNVTSNTAGYPILLKELRKRAKIILQIRNHLANAEQIELPLPVSAEWLMDNMHVIQSNIEEIQRNLPQKYYYELPKLPEGAMKGLPRIYAIARELVYHTANRITRENITAFLTGYQSISPLTIGELWALPLMIRFRLIECIQYVAIRIDRRLCEGELASYWGNRILNVSRREPEKLNFFLSALAEEIPDPSPHFAEELIDHLFDAETVLPLVQKWVEERLHDNFANILKKEQKQKITDESAISGAIISLIGLSQISWRDVFESVSPVDAILNQDPAQIYSGMNFATRDSYRATVERLAQRSNKSETEIAKEAVAMASSGEQGRVENHVGFYLIDKGRPQLENFIEYSPSFIQRIRRSLLRHPTLTYFSSIAVLIASILGLWIYLSLHEHITLLHTILFALLALGPASEFAIQTVNFLSTFLKAPFILPKMSSDQPIDEQNRTLVVVPTLLIDRKNIAENLSRLEIHYLANSDNALRFALFTDFTDAPQKTMEQDTELFNLVTKGIESLAAKYGKDRFFLFHRERVWSSSERAWIGWERKRGKLEYLNLYLTGHLPPEVENILKIGPPEALANIRYVITLDSDTQMPKGKARELVATIVHPLNVPQLSKEGLVERGYAIIQPRVSSSFTEGSLSLFSYLFSDVSGVDPYSNAISDVYQDLMNEGTYHGKGIYDVHAFQSNLSNHFPDAHLLSHDLLEGAHLRVGFSSDISLFDSFPKDYFSWCKRQLRWMRGDWQIFDWLFCQVPHKTKVKIKNPLSLLNRWKIFDNMRRALQPVLILALLIAAWFFSSKPWLWTTFAVLVLFTAPLLNFLSSCIQSPHLLFLSWRTHLRDVWRILALITFLPHQAGLALKAFFLVIYRRFVSHRHLLEWTPASLKASSIPLFTLGSWTLFALIIFFGVVFYHPIGLYPALPFCLLWAFSPLIVYFLDRPLKVLTTEKLSFLEKQFLRQIARKTWRYFDEFVNAQSHWLPPDNYQAALGIELALRTSPTNIGLWLLSAASSYDLKFITCDTLVDRILPTVETLKKMDKYEGHLFNWYDIQNLKVLYPRYVSTVDSGNFLACLWTLEQFLYQMAASPILSDPKMDGIRTLFELFIKESHDKKSIEKIHPLKEIIDNEPTEITQWFKIISDSLQLIQSLKKQDKSYWIGQLEKLLNEWDTILHRYFSWALILQAFPAEDLEKISPQAQEWRLKGLQWNPSLEDLAAGHFPPELISFIKEDLPPEFHTLKEALHTAQWLAGEKLGLVHEILSEIAQQSQAMNMSFLFNPEKKLFSIGFQVDEFKLDPSYYDLLASEARISSLVSIAKGDVPLEHWWALGRPYSYVYGRKVLLSWGGTMFEYLMPLLFNRYYPDSLLGEACKEAVACQIIYGHLRGIPWGISEAAFSEIDIRKTYQYRSFGIPGLGLKRGLEDDLVVSPYSTALALTIQPLASIENLKELSKGSLNLYADYGYYESVDFSRQHDVKGARGVTVYAFMAHHQGMSFLSINNVLNDNIIPNRFHTDPRIQGVESLLYEKPPLYPPTTRELRKTLPAFGRLAPFSTVPLLGKTETPDSVTPKVNLLSNSDYSVMVTNSGGGYSRWRDYELTRWRSDTTCDSWGSFCYIKDTQSGKLWSTTYHPTRVKGTQYSVSFKADKVEFSRRDYQIETTMDIIVSPEDNVEIRSITLANLSRETRHLELTTYSELVLAPHATDLAHPAFNKLFIQTEAEPNLYGLLATRRRRSEEEKPFWMAHFAAFAQPPQKSCQFETDRTRFIGRGGSLQNPTACHHPLSNTTGTVLDPIFSLRYCAELKPGERIQVAFITAAAEQYDEVLSLMKKYSDLEACHRAQELAWTHAQLDLRHLRIHQEEVQLFQKLASRILYPHAQLRPSIEKLLKNQLCQSHLWTYGISGDLPIIAINVAEIHEIDLVKQALIAHAFWRLRGLKTDLVILNEESTGYEHPLSDQIRRVIHSYPHFAEMNQPGGIFLLNCDQIPEEDLTLILSVSRANLIAARGSLRQQVVSPLHPHKHLPLLQVAKVSIEDPSEPLPFLELPYFNGYGGFTRDGKSYVIYLDKNRHTPVPWSNIMANKNFGTMVSEAGEGCSWFGNSQTNRITPWSNDPLLDPVSEALYIRDDKLGTIWSSTPAPIREFDPYRIWHGQNYTRYEHNSHGINQDLLIFVPVDQEGGEPIKIQRLRLTNRSSRRRSLSVFSYAELVLGTNREDTQMHIVTEWDPESQALFAFNRYNTDFGCHMAFLTSNVRTHSFTADRAEFIGRNNTLSNPAALKREALSNATGAALDPCAALQVKVEIDPGEQIDLCFTLGYAENPTQARQLILKCRDYNWIDQAFASTQKWWDDLLDTVKVDLPDLAMNFALNRWLLYQTLSCRIWGRSAFYQSSGAYGFRDQLQDVMALIYAAPKISREQILRAASRQFVEGDVQHWWHPPACGGVRTRISDDLLWLPYVTAHYVKVTGDLSILDEKIPFIKGELLKDGQQEAYFIPEISEESETLLEHCRRAIHKGMTAGPHGLPLIGSGDWNDGMNRVGIHGKGESVWLGWFFINVMNDFAELLTAHGQPEDGVGFKLQAQRLAETIENTAWDGKWYKRAYFDDGTPLGSKDNIEDTIDSLSQSWAWISGAGNLERSHMALQSVEEMLVKPEAGMVLLLTPPFDKLSQDPGYIKGYPPGVRENGGQYTHGSLWVPMAFARSGDGNKAVELLRMMYPITRVHTPQDVARYKAEPYVLAGDVYALPSQIGRGGWTWYTGSSGWMYRIWLEEILGFQMRGDRLRLAPVLHSSWEKVALSYRYKNHTRYEISIENPHRRCRGEVVLELDGKKIEGHEILLTDDGAIHHIRATIQS